jgi:lysophospholipase L1-like esterase
MNTASNNDAKRWVAAWCAAQQVPGDDSLLPVPGPGPFTLRQTVRPSLGGRNWRLRLSNLFGQAPLQLQAVHLARALGAGRSGIGEGSDVAVHFDGQPALQIAPGASACSDVLHFEHRAGEDLAVSIVYAQAPQGQTGHPGSRTTSFVLPGAHAHASDLPDATPTVHWYQLSDLEVLTEARARLLVATGDSITDGRGSTTDGNNRWTDQLLPHLARARAADPALPPLAVVQTALGGNRVLRDGIGPSLRSRFERDVLQRQGVTHLLLLEGVNDLGTRPATGLSHAALLADLQAAIAEMCAQARRAGLRCLLGTVMPYGGNDGYAPDAADEAARQAFNAWIRRPGTADAVADFDAAVRDPARPDRMLPAFHDGDWLHPSPAGLAAMAAAVPLHALLEP